MGIEISKEGKPYLVCDACECRIKSRELVVKYDHRGGANRYWSVIHDGCETTTTADLTTMSWDGFIAGLETSVGDPRTALLRALFGLAGGA